MSIVSRFREKYLSTIAKPRNLVSPDGEVYSSLDARGAEVLDPTPMAPPVGYRRQPSLAEQIREMVRSERLAAEVEAAGAETFEEADDFDIEDDYDPSSDWENEFDPDYRDIVKDVESERAATSRSRVPKDKVGGDQPPSVTEPAEPASSAEPEGD